jgi:TonB-dependent SusC/RagA subfamily outer membrane receptor
MRRTMRRFSSGFALAVTLGCAHPVAAQLWLANHVTYLQTPPLFLREADGRVEAVDGNLTWLLGRRLSLQLERVTIKHALTEITRQTGLFLAYSDDVLPPDARVSVHAADMTLAAALSDVLSDTDLDVVFSQNGQATLVKRSAPVQVGTVGGYARDSLTGRPLGHTVVSVEGLALTVTTTDSGFYLMQVPVGRHVLRAKRIGYRPAEQTVVVVDSQSVEIDFRLSPSPTQLDAVIVTATGPRRRVELGNDITVLNPDSIATLQPVRNVTDLLATHVPGLEVQHTSGTPGDPARLRLRGASSVLETNDPIVIVNGIRVYSDQSSARGANLATGQTFAAPSPIDQIDPTSIETIEVLKGPSAATLYGQDAANGVIVITTKRGQAGPPRWTTSIERGLTNMPGAYPLAYFRFGHGLADNTSRPCTLQDMTCVTDSVVRFQLLNVPQYTVLGQGNRTAVTAGVSGGATSGLTYAFSGDISDELGLIRLPAVETSRYAASHGGSTPPDWLLRPDQYTRWGATSRLSAQLGKTATVDLTAMFGRGHQYRSTLEQDLQGLMGTYYNATTGRYYLATFSTFSSGNTDLLSRFYQRVEDIQTTFTNGASLNWQPQPWLQASVDAGLQFLNREDQGLLEHGLDPVDTAGFIDIGRGQSLVSTANIRATATTQMPLGFRLQTAVGANYTHTSTNDFQESAQGLAPGTSSFTQASQFSTPQGNALDVKSFGWYVEPTFSQKRFWISTGIRIDGGSTFGTHVTLPVFPKLSFSYLVSDEPWFPARRLVNSLRLRAAYGRAGTWPGPADQLRLFTNVPQFVDSQQVLTTELSALGNTQLRPERSTEIEGGFDADLLDNRFSITVTAYRKMRFDALLQVPLPASVGGAGVVNGLPATVLKNVGVIRNTGLELTLGIQAVRSDLVTWGGQLNLTRNRNMVVSLGPGITPFFLSAYQRVAAGYPLFGFWARPVAGYADVNHDGVIEPTELLFGDSAVFMGDASPAYQASWHTTLALLRGALTVDAGFDYQHGLTQLNQTLSQNQVFSQGLNDPNASLGQQAAAAALPQTLYGAYQTVSTLRFNSVTVSYRMPPAVARRFGAAALTLAVQGANLGLWTSYRGKDPDVNVNPTGNQVTDGGQLPVPRTWQVRLSASY